jgi:hypothetical protein
MFIIVNLTEGLESTVWKQDCRIPEKNRPSYVHDTLTEAEAEALRLTEKYGGRFVIFQAIAETTQRTVMIPTKVCMINPLHKLEGYASA